MPMNYLMNQSFYLDPEDDAPTNQSSPRPLKSSGNPSVQGNLKNHGQPILIDTDAGTDDAWGIFMTLAHQTTDIKVVGVTTVYGNTSVDNVVVNVTRTLQVAGENSIPIYKGMNTSMVDRFEHFEEPPYNGHDGFGDAVLPPIEPRFEEEHAVDAIAKMAEQYQGRLDILCLGPLTNVAMALRLHPQIRHQIRRLYIIGGNVEGVGNVTPSAEFNFFVDPEAAHVVLEGFDYGTIQLLPWEIAMRQGSTAHSWRVNELGNVGGPKIDLLNAIEADILERYTDNWLVSDAVIAACLIDPTVAQDVKKLYCGVELRGDKTRGQLVVDRNFLIERPANVDIIMKIDAEKYQSMLKSTAASMQKKTR